jgi:hypothetical protein
MCASKSAAGIFGSRATAIELWDADPAALARCYPDPVGERPYDGSSADAALAQHLAFWTGNDCDRMKRLMLRSKLARDKWDREDYLPRTILSATARQKDVCHDKVNAPPTDYTIPQTNEARSVEGDRFMDAAQQIIVFYKCVYVADINMILMPGGHRFGQERFDNLLGGYTFIMDRNNTKTTKSAWEAFTKSQAVDFPKALTSEFRPEREPGLIWIEGNQRIVNSFWPVKTPSRKGNAAPFLQHLAKMLPNDNDRQIVLSYMAAIVQYPGVKFQWAPLIQGAEGNGKTLLSRCLIKAIGKEFCHSPKSSEITEKFNGWTCNKIFISVEDVYTPRDKMEVIEELKPLITNDWLEIRGMGMEKITRHICCNFMLNSNHKDAIKKTRNDRRFAVFYTAQQCRKDLERDGMGGSYFPDLYNWLKRDGYEIVTEYLRNYPIPDEFNPARESHRAPVTSSHNEVILASMGRMEQEITDAVESDRIGFRGGWISSHFLDQLIKDVGMDRMYSRSKRREMLADMGYEPHPGLTNGQCNNAVRPDGMKPRLWLLGTHSAMGLTGAAVSRAYEQAQESNAGPGVMG